MRCWACDVSELYDGDAFSRAMESLPWEERRQRAMGYRFAKDRALCLGVGLLAARALKIAGAEDLSLGYRACGKPFLVHHPDIHFNLSHSSTLAVCAVASVPVGVDVEERQACDWALVERCCSDAERRWIRAQQDADAAFTRIWTRKESYLKLLGTGIADDLQSIDVAPGSTLDDAVVFWEQTVAGNAICACCAVPNESLAQGSPSRSHALSGYNREGEV